MFSREVRLPRRMEAHREAGHSIVITGAAGGIGTAITRRLLQDGWIVVATWPDRDFGPGSVRLLHGGRCG